jgi:hypothetical protein
MKYQVTPTGIAVKNEVTVIKNKLHALVTGFHNRQLA